MVTRLSVVYKSPEVDIELDKEIIEFFNKLDFVCIDRTYFDLIFRREIFFEKQSEIDAEKKMAKTMEEVNGSKRSKEAQLTT